MSDAGMTDSRALAEIAKAPAGSGLAAIFSPASIAIIGASQDPSKLGGRPLQLLMRFGYRGTILPVNPRATEVQGLPAYASIAALPVVPDLAVIAVGADQVQDAAEACAARGVKAAIVFASGPPP